MLAQLNPSIQRHPGRKFVFLFSLKRYCPECRGKDIRKSTRRGIHEKSILPLFLLRPFRCMACNSRYYGLFFAARTYAEIPKEPLPGSPTKL